MSEINLELVSIDELIEEVGKRFDHWVFTGIQIRQKHKDGTGTVFTHRRYSGNNAMCQGLCQQMNHYLSKEYFDDEVDDIEE